MEGLTFNEGPKRLKGPKRGIATTVDLRPEWKILGEDYGEKYSKPMTYRHVVRPGITGLPQVKYPYGRGVTDAKNKLEI